VTRLLNVLGNGLGSLAVVLLIVGIAAVPTQQARADDDPQACPDGQVWNGERCVAAGCTPTANGDDCPNATGSTDCLVNRTCDNVNPLPLFCACHYDVDPVTFIGTCSCPP
jgi:hypothetical protein